MSMKRANGTGSVYKMKHKPLRKPYRAVVTTGYDEKGKCKRKTIGYYAKSKEAWDALSEYGIYPVSVRTIAKILEHLQVDPSEEDDFWGIDPV